MGGSVAVLVLRFFGRTPLVFNHWLGRCLGYLVWRTGGRERHVAETNLAWCFPGNAPEWHQRMACESIKSMGAAMLEAPKLWRMSPVELQARLENPKVLQEILSIYQQGKGLVVASPHLGSWEYTGLLLASEISMITMFQPPKYPEVGRFVESARQRTGARLAPTDAAGIRALSKALAHGECVGILPDQEPEWGNGVFATFFGRPAYTMFLLPRLVQKRRTPVLFVFSERLEGGRYRMHCLQADDALYSKDREAACLAMNQAVEALVRKRLDQYNWNYKRFLTQPDGIDIYKKET